MARRFINIVGLSLAVLYGMSWAFAQSEEEPLGSGQSPAKKTVKPATKDAKTKGKPSKPAPSGGVPPVPLDPAESGADDTRTTAGEKADAGNLPELKDNDSEILEKPTDKPGDEPLSPGTVPALPDPASKSLDENVEKVQGEAQESATSPANPTAISGAAPANGAPTTPFVLPADRLAIGPQSVGLSVEVRAHPVVNLNKETTINIVVQNNGKSEATGVIVRDLLPDGVVFVNEGQAEPIQTGQLLTWKLGSLEGGKEQILKFKVKPVAAGSFDHSATITMMAGAKVRTTVKHPRLRVEQRATPSSKVLKGQEVRFDLTVTNPGTGPATKVVVQAKLSPGLVHPKGLHIRRVLPNPIAPNESIAIDPIFAEAVAGGDQTCEVTVSSPDVADEGKDDARIVLATVHVIEPKLKLSLTGMSRRTPGTLSDYKLAIENPGTAPAQKVRVSVNLPPGVVFKSARGANFDRARNTLNWNVPSLDPEKKSEFHFQVKMGSIQRYHFEAAAVAAGSISEKADFYTDVSGIAAVRLTVVERAQAVDVNEETDFEIKIKNYGSKDATKLLVSAKLSDNLQAVEIASDGTDSDGRMSRSGVDVQFPLIDRLGPGQEQNLTIKVRAIKPGVGSCKVTLMHDGLSETGKIVSETPLNVMDPRP